MHLLKPKKKLTISNPACIVFLSVCFVFYLWFFLLPHYTTLSFNWNKHCLGNFIIWSIVFSFVLNKYFVVINWKFEVLNNEDVRHWLRYLLCCNWKYYLQCIIFLGNLLWCLFFGKDVYACMHQTKKLIYWTTHIPA